MNKVIEVLSEDSFITHISSIVEFSKSKRNVDNLWTIFVAQAFVILSSENSLYAFINHLWAYMVHVVVTWRIEIWMRFWKNKNGFESFCLLVFGRKVDSVANIWPFLRRVVSVQENDLFHVRIFVLVLIWWTVISNFVKIGLMSLSENFVDCLMRINFGMCLTVILSMLSQYLIKVNSQEFNFHISFGFLMFNCCSLFETLYLRVLLFLMGVNSLIKIILTCSAQESRKSGFSKSRKTNWNQNKFVDSWLFFCGHVRHKILI